MNTEQFNHFKKTIPDFVKKYCWWESITNITFDKYNSQIRAKGHVYDKVPRVGQQLLDEGQHTPCDVRGLPTGTPWELKEGCTRVLGAEDAGIDKVFVCDYLDRVLKYTRRQWRVWQAQANEHPLSSSNTDEDILFFISEDVRSGDLDAEVGFKYRNNEKRYLEKAADYYKNTVYTRNGRRIDWFQARVGECLQGQIALNYENYNDKKALEFYKNNGSKNWTGKNVGEISNDVAPYCLKSEARMSPNVMGNVLYKAIDNPNTDFDVIAWVADLPGKDDKDILTARASIAKKWDKITSAYPQGWKNLYFLPQIKSGPNKENLHQLIKAR